MPAVTRAALVALAVVALGAACTEKGRSLLLVDVTAPSISGLQSATVIVTDRNNANVGGAQRDWTGAGTLKVGIYLDKSVNGAVGAVACGFNAGGLVASGVAPDMVTARAGEQAGPLMVTLSTTTLSPLCISGGMGGRGGGGGTGGSAGGTGGGVGSGGVSGTGGAGGSAGMGGTGGSSGAVGTGGRGGAGGSDGAGGAAGRGGTGGGTAGSAAGAGGRGGAGGTGGSAGTGGGGTGGPRWRGPFGVSESPAIDERTPSVAVAPNGKAVVVFDKAGQVWASCYDPAANGGQGKWLNPGAVGNGTGYQLPVVAVDGVGRFTAAWAQAAGTTTNGVWQATSDDCINWVVGQMPLSTAYALQVAIAVNGDGAAVAAWAERDPISNNMQAVAKLRSSPTASWSPAQVMLNGNDTSDRLPAVGMTTVGEAFVVWQQIGGAMGIDSVWYQKASPTGAWAGATLLETYEGGRAYAPAIASNGNNAIMTYLQLSQMRTTVELWARRYIGGSFQPELRVAEASFIDSTVPPSVTLDNDGTATVAWVATGTSGFYNVQVNRAAAAATSWPAPTTTLDGDNQALVNAGISQAPMPSVRGDGTGNVMLVWRKRPANTMRFDLFASRFTAGAWGTAAMMIETTDSINGSLAGVFTPALASNGSGVAVAAWYYGGNDTAVYANVFR